MPKPANGSSRPPENAVVVMIETRNFRLVGRSTREIARYTGLSEEVVESTLRASPVMWKAPCGLWGFAHGEDPAHEPLSIDHTKAPPKVAKKALPKEVPKAMKIEEPPTALKDDSSIDSLFEEL